MARKFPIHPRHPERICWGCDRYCAADSLSCGNGSERTQHPMEIWGDDWAEWGQDPLIPGASSERPAGSEPRAPGASDDTPRA